MERYKHTGFIGSGIREHGSEFCGGVRLSLDYRELVDYVRLGIAALYAGVSAAWIQDG